MAVPDFQSLMLPVLQAAQAGEVNYQSAMEQIAHSLHLSEEDRKALLPSGRASLLYNRVHWAKTFLAQAGLLATTRRGWFVITAEGKQVLSERPDRIDARYLTRFPQFLAFKARRRSRPEETQLSEMIGVEEKRTPDERIRAAHDEIEEDLREELLRRILDAPPDFFEEVVVLLLLAMGYGGGQRSAGRVLGRSGDGGIDGVIDQDALGLDRVYVQAKRYMEENSVGASAIRDFFGSLDRFKANKGLFITTSSFSREASATAEQLSKRIVLIDGEALTRLMVRYGVGCRIEATLHIKKVDEDFFLT